MAMKGLKELQTYVSKYDVKVRQFLSYAEIQNIINAVKEFSTWGERETCKDMMILMYCTDIDKTTLEDAGHDMLLKSGFIDAVKEEIYNVYDIDRGLHYEESLDKSIATIAKKLPEISDRIKEVSEGGNKSGT